MGDTNKLTIPIDEVKPWDKNPREITDDDFKKLRKKIKRWGIWKPFLVWKSKKIILGGNQRYKACKDLGHKDIWVEYIEPKDEAEALEIAITDNESSGDWVKGQLTDLLLESQDKILLDDYKIDIKYQGLAELLPNEIEDDNYEEPEVTETDIESGDVIQLGDHRLLCGDATSKEDVDVLMDGKRADMVFTDPPYNVDYGSSKNQMHKNRTILNDNLSPDDWVKFNVDWVSNVLENYGGGDVYIWGASGPSGVNQRRVLNELGFHWSATIIWKKQHFVLSPANYQRIYEPCYYGWKTKSTYDGGRKRTDVWEIERPGSSKEHPTMKPIALCSMGIRNSSKKRDIVLDVFGGSGSTLIACEQLGRKCYMMEIDPAYCEVICQRWEKYTGKLRKKASGKTDKK